MKTFKRFLCSLMVISLAVMSISLDSYAADTTASSESAYSYTITLATTSSLPNYWVVSTHDSFSIDNPIA